MWKEISLGQICVLILDDIPDSHLNTQYLGPETPGTLAFSVSFGFNFKKNHHKIWGPPTLFTLEESPDYSDYTTHSFVIFVFWFRFHWKFEQYCCCAAPHPSPPPACSPRDITRQAAVAPSLEGETTTIQPWLRIFRENILRQPQSISGWEYLPSKRWMSREYLVPSKILRRAAGSTERGNWEGQLTASAEERQGELIGIKNRSRLVKDGSDIQLRHGQARQG